MCKSKDLATDSRKGRLSGYVVNKTTRNRNLTFMFLNITFSWEYMHDSWALFILSTICANDFF